MKALLVAALLLAGFTAAGAPAMALPAEGSRKGAASTHQGPLRVSPEGPYRTLAEALVAAERHDTIRIGAGVYREGLLTLTRPVTLLGEPGAVLDGAGRSGLLELRADSVTVRSLTFRNTGSTFSEDRAAITVERSRFCTLRDNQFEDTFFGIYLANSGDCLVADNTLQASGARETASGNGIHLWYSARVEIRDNVIRGHRDGIYLEFVEDSRVEGNVSEGNLRYGLHFMFSDDCVYRRNRFTRNGAGVAVMYTRGIVMEENDFDRNRGSAAFGLLMKDITDSRLEGNRFRRNSVGIHAEGVSRVTVRGNDFIENGWAIKLMANSEGSSFTGNNFLGNSFDLATNSRRASSEFEGNHWDRYEGYDRDRDGVGDLPFRPVRLFSLLVEQNEPALVLQRSFLVTLLDLAERVIPLLTPENLEDSAPLLLPNPTRWSGP